MLILSLRVGESVRAGADISITVLRVKGNQVRLGVSAPKNVAVHREGSGQIQPDATGKLGEEAFDEKGGFRD